MAADAGTQDAAESETHDMKTPDAPNPICVYVPPCGSRIVYGASVTFEGVIDTPFRCTRCGATGIRSERTDTAAAEARP